MNYYYGKGVHNCVLCWEVVPISEGPLLEVPLGLYLVISIMVATYLYIKVQ